MTTAAIVTDTHLQRDVQDELRRQPNIGAAEIGVAVNDGIVTLAGELKNPCEMFFRN